MRHVLIFALAGFGCAENEFHISPSRDGIPAAGTVTGRVCDPLTQQWLAGALVYAHEFDEQGIVYDTLLTQTDVFGTWTLELTGNRTYDIYVQDGDVVIDQFPVAVLEGEHMDLPEPACFGPVEASVAVVSGDYDNLADLLPELGISSWTRVNGQTGDEITQFFLDEEGLAAFDIVFLDGGHLEQGVFYGPEPDVSGVNRAIRRYVKNGGTLFASDWSYDVVEINWPDAVEFRGDDTVPDAAQLGDIAMVSARAMDDGFAAVLGTDVVDVSYDYAVWPVIEDVAPDVTVYLEGDAPWRAGQDTGVVAHSPLLVGFSEGSGMVYLSTYRQGANAHGSLLDGLRALLP
jgi:hypothetical protein